MSRRDYLNEFSEINQPELDVRHVNKTEQIVSNRMSRFDRENRLSNWCLYFGLAMLAMNGCYSPSMESTDAKPKAKEQIRLQPTELVNLEDAERLLELVDQGVSRVIAFKWTNGIAYGSVYFETENGGQEQYVLPIKKEVEELRKILPKVTPKNLNFDPSQSDYSPHEVAMVCWSWWFMTATAFPNLSTAKLF